MILGRRLPYMPQLDSLRAAAVTVVMLWHFTSRDTVARELAVSAGVRLFFVLSGFLITALLLNARDDARAQSTTTGAAARRFYVRRAVRIMPIYYGTLLVCAALHVPSIEKMFWWHATYLSNVKFALAGFEGPGSHFWSLASEEQFYLVWPWVVLFTPPSKLRRVCVAAAGGALLFRLLATSLGHGGFDYLVFGQLDALGGGALLAIARHEQRLEDTLRRARLGIGALSVVVVLLFASGLAATDAGGTLGTTLWTLLLVPVVGHAALGFRGAVGSILNFPPIRYVGRISYGVYVYHLFMPKTLHALAAAAAIRLPTTGLPALLLAIAASLLVASASWHLVERPLSLLRDRLESRSSAASNVIQ